MSDALVGWTGFVGGNLLASRRYDDHFNSANVGAMAGREFDRVVFSAAKAEKWRINQDPAADLMHIEELEGVLGGFYCRELVLISTVDVYPAPVGVEETTDISAQGLHAYGAHRLRLEATARRLHDRVVVVRLPGLFGPGLKKNVVFDLLHENGVERIDPASSFQYYDLTALADHVDLAVEEELDLVNLVTEPVSTERLAREVFRRKLPTKEGVAASYDIRSVHADRFGGRNGYIWNADEVVDRLKRFIEGERA